jgi:CRISPR-associated endoribonuclease Cas6
MLVDPFFEVGKVRLRVSQIKIENIHIPDGISSIEYESLGEIVIKKAEKTGITQHYTVKDDLSRALKEIIERQSEAATHVKSEIELELLSAKQRRRVIYKDNVAINSFIALRLAFRIRTNAKVHEFMLTQGIGHHRKLGFGMLSIKNKRV